MISKRNDPVGLSLPHNFLWTLGGNVIFAGAQWGAVILLAKIGNSDMVGHFALASAVTYPVTLIANLKLRDVFITDLADKYPFGELVGLRLLLTCVAILALLGICGLPRYGAEMTAIMLVLGVSQLVDCLSENYYAIMQRYERMDRLARSLIFRSILSVSSLAVIVHYTGSLLWGVCGYVVARVIILLTFDAARATFAIVGIDSNVSWTLLPRESLWQRLQPRWNLCKQMEMLWVALPLGVVTILVSVNGNVPRYVIEHHLGAHQLGIYSALAYLPQGCFMVTMALIGAAFARLSRMFFAGDISGFGWLLARVSAICVGLGMFGLAGIALFGRQLVTFVYKPEYAQHLDVLRWLMIVGVVQCISTCLGGALTAAAEFRVQVPLFAIVTLVSLIGCQALVPKAGLVGAAAASLGSVLVQGLSSGVLILRAISKRRSQIRERGYQRAEASLEVQPYNSLS